MQRELKNCTIVFLLPLLKICNAYMNLNFPVIYFNQKFNFKAAVKERMNFTFNNMCNRLNLLNSQIKSQQ